MEKRMKAYPLLRKRAARPGPCLVAWLTAWLRFCAAFCSLACTAQAADLALGKTTYDHNCAACHQPNGAGIPGAFPALKASPLVLGDADSLLQVVLAGRGGMPTFNASLSNNEVAAVVSYIRSEWGNQASAIAATQAERVSRSITAVADDGGRGN